MKVGLGVHGAGVEPFMHGSRGIGGTGGSGAQGKTTGARLILPELARTSSMTTSDSAEAVPHEHLEDPPAPPDDREFVIVIPSQEALTPWERRAAEAGPWPIRVHFPSAVGLNRMLGQPKVEPPCVDFEGMPYLLTPKEVATLLRTTVGAIYARVERGQIAGVVKQGRRVLFHRDAVRRVLDREANASNRRLP